MASHAQIFPVSKKMIWAGWIISALPVLMLLFSAVLKLMQLDAVAKEFSRLGYDSRLVFGLGILELICAFVYVIPGTSVLGAVLLTGYFGGAVATHLRVGDPFVQVVAPVGFGVFVWLGLFLRDARLRALLPLRKGAETWT